MSCPGWLHRDLNAFPFILGFGTGSLEGEFKLFLIFVLKERVIKDFCGFKV